MGDGCDLVCFNLLGGARLISGLVHEYMENKENRNSG
jgi:hypothetical protein